MPEMFDSIDASQIPAGQDDAGYVDGRWPNFTTLHGPNNLSIAVFASDNADALDDEPGDATNAQAGPWVKRELSLGHWRPCVYTSVSNVPALLAALAGAGITRTQVRIWTAHYTYQTHRCTHACNAGLPTDFVADATQWTDRSGGRNLDESTVADDFFGTQPAPIAPAPAPFTIGDDVQVIPIQFMTDAAGWFAGGVDLPSGATKDHVCGIVIDWASAYDGAWNACNASVDFSVAQPGQARYVAKGNPSSFYTGRVFVAV